MDQLSAMDAAFLYIEAPALPQHVLGIMLLDAREAGDAYSTDRFRTVLAERLHLMPAFTRRLVQVPLGLDHPYWAHDPDVDLDAHLHELTCPAPGDLRALGRLVGELGATPLRRDRPLWELWLVDGLEQGHVALVAKLHHATLYGSAGADLMAQLLDLEPEPAARPADAPAAPSHEPLPGSTDLLLRAALNGARRPLRAVGGLVSATRRVGAVGGTVVRAAARRAPVTLPFSAPRTPLNGRLTERREAAFTKVSFADITAVKDAFGTKVNDVVLAAVTASLRAYLVARDAVPDRPLVASVPVNLGAGAVEGTDRITALLVPLPVGTADPVEQLLQVAEHSRASKDMTEMLGPDAVGEMADLVPPLLVVGGSKVYERFGLSRLHPPLQTLVVSNMPGPPIPLYCAGARVEAVYPFGPLLPGSGLNITVLSNMGSLDVGLLGCPDVVEDLWEIADGFPAAVRALRAACETAPSR